MNRRSFLQALAALPVVGVLVRKTEPAWRWRWYATSTTFSESEVVLNAESEPDTMTALMVREQDKVPPTFHGIPLEYDRNLDEVAGPPRYYFVPKGRA